MRSSRLNIIIKEEDSKMNMGQGMMGATIASAVKGRGDYEAPETEKGIQDDVESFLAGLEKKYPDEADEVSALRDAWSSIVNKSEAAEA